MKVLLRSEGAVVVGLLLLTGCSKQAQESSSAVRQDPAGDAYSTALPALFATKLRSGS